MLYLVERSEWLDKYGEKPGMQITGGHWRPLVVLALARVTQGVLARFHEKPMQRIAKKLLK